MNQRRKRAFWVVVAVGIAIVLYGLLLRQRRFWHARKGWHECQGLLIQISGAKQMYVMENNLKPGSPIAWKDLDPLDPAFVAKGPSRARCSLRKCPVTGAEYILNPDGTDPVCPSGLPGHSIAEFEKEFNLKTH